MLMVEQKYAHENKFSPIKLRHVQEAEFLALYPNIAKFKFHAMLELLNCPYMHLKNILCLHNFEIQEYTLFLSQFLWLGQFFRRRKKIKHDL
jgi:hypothetical protein